MHTPVMVPEVLALLRPSPGEWLVDATVGLGGHSEAILERIQPGGRLLGLDCDVEALEHTRKRLGRFGNAVALVHGNFRDLATHVATWGRQADGALFDLGLSSHQLASAARGFSFSLEGPLDMRMDTSGGMTAGDVLRRASVADLERILREFGQERYARRIARAIVENRRRLRTTGDLARLVERVVPRRERRIHPATRTFQALRIAVNDELGALDEALASLPRWLAPGGRVAVISFHSLEDGIVKRRLREFAAAGDLVVLTPKPLRPTPQEVAANPRARSARLRAAERPSAN